MRHRLNKKIVELLKSCEQLIEHLEMEFLPTDATRKDYPVTFKIIKRAKQAISKIEKEE